MNNIPLESYSEIDLKQPQRNIVFKNNVLNLHVKKSNADIILYDNRAEFTRASLTDDTALNVRCKNAIATIAIPNLVPEEVIIRYRLFIRFNGHTASIYRDDNVIVKYIDLFNNFSIKFKQTFNGVDYERL